MEKEIIYTTYANETDITFIMKEVYVEDEIKSMEVVGFYFGESNTEDTNTFMGKLKAEFTL